MRPSLAQQEKERQMTSEVVREIVDEKVSSVQRATVNKIRTEAESRYVAYTPQSGGTRVVQVREAQEDPFAPPQFKVKRIPHGPKGTPDVLMRAPPKKVTQEDQANWKIPPCISNSRNSRGFVLPLEMRISADGRGSYDPRINERFVEFAGALYDAEKNARRELEDKARVKQTLAYEEMRKKEEELRAEIEDTKRKRENALGLSEIASSIAKEEPDRVDGDSVAESQRELLRYMVKKNAEREARLDRIGTNKQREVRDKERDIAERVALGQGGGAKRDALEVDERVLGLGAGVDAGHKGDDVYDLYDKPLFAEQIETNVYTGVRDYEASDMGDALTKRNNRGGNESHKSRVLKRNKPVEFEKFEDDK